MSLDLSALDPVFLTSEANDAGISAGRLRTAHGQGLLERPGRGVWVDVARRPEDVAARHRLLAAAAARSVPRSAVSHVSAALLHGLPNPGHALPRPAVTVHDGVRSRAPGAWMTLLRGKLPEDAIVLVDGVPTTLPARTVIDCARHLSVGDALAMTDAALATGLVRLDDLVAERRLQARWPGVTRADTVLRLMDPRRESWLESFSAAAFHRTGLPPGVPQVLVHDEWGRFIARVDAGWAELGVVGEADGRTKYLGTVDAETDRSPEAVSRRLVDAGERESALRSTGLGVVRWTTKEIRHDLLGVRARWVSEVARTDLRRVRAVLTCSCCHHPLTSCDLRALYGPEAPRNRT